MGETMRNWHLASAAVITSLAAGPALADPAPVFNWSGYYIGVDGGIVGLKDVLYDLDHWYPQDSYELSPSGGLLGVYGGANWQFGMFVLGVEGDVAGAWADEEHAWPGVTQSVDLHGIATLRGRAGVAWDRILIYATGGLALGNLTNSVLTTSTDKKASGWRPGWTLGGGAEIAITDKLVARGEVLYADFGDDTVDDNGYRFRFDDTAVIGRAGISFRF
jgi:outer membrane immunogenic protein